MASLQQLAASLQGLSASSFGSESERVAARNLLFDALRRVQSPWDIAWSHTWVSPAVSATVRTLIEMDAFKKWVSHSSSNGDGFITATTLATLTSSSPDLMARLLRVLAGERLILEVGVDTYSPTPWSRELGSDDSFPGIYGHFYSDMVAPVLNHMPESLASIGYKNPEGVDECAFTHWPGSEGKRLFDWAAEKPLFARDINGAMVSHSRHNLSQWVDLYPSETILEAAKEGRALVVDIGGGQGHDLEKFAKIHADADTDKAELLKEGSLILHDLPGILEQVKPQSKAIEIQAHDFFTPEPVKGARAYFIHNVLHDWADDKAGEILVNIAGAMEKGYSRLLIHESLVTERDPPARISISDVHMLACFGAAERSEGQWRSLIEGAGLRIVKIWRPEGSAESVIEAEVA